MVMVSVSFLWPFLASLGCALSSDFTPYCFVARTFSPTAFRLSCAPGSLIVSPVCLCCLSSLCVCSCPASLCDRQLVWLQMGGGLFPIASLCLWLRFASLFASQDTLLCCCHFMCFPGDVLFGFSFYKVGRVDDLQPALFAFDKPDTRSATFLFKTDTEGRGTTVLSAAIVSREPWSLPSQKHSISIPSHSWLKTDTEGRGTPVLSVASVFWQSSPPLLFLLCIMVLIGWSDGKKTLVAESEIPPWLHRHQESTGFIMQGVEKIEGWMKIQHTHTHTRSGTRSALRSFDGISQFKGIHGLS